MKWQGKKQSFLFISVSLRDLRMFKASLPIPPSVNAAYRSANRGGKTFVHKSKEYKDWSVLAGRLFQFHHKNLVPMQGRLVVEYKFCFKDKRRRDIANYEKALTDFLEEQNVFVNDEQIDDIRMLRLPVNKDKAGVFIKVKEVKNG